MHALPTTPTTSSAGQTTETAYSEQQDALGPDSRSGCFRHRADTVAKSLVRVGLCSAVIVGATAATIGGLFGYITEADDAPDGISTKHLVAGSATGGAAAGAAGSAIILGIYHLHVVNNIPNLLGRLINHVQPSQQETLLLCHFKDRAVTSSDVVSLLTHTAVGTAVGVAAGAGVALDDSANGAGVALDDSANSVATGAALGTLFIGSSSAIFGALWGGFSWYERTTPVIDNRIRTQSEPDSHLPSTSSAYLRPAVAPKELTPLNPEGEAQPTTDVVIEISQV